jgi:hypothetical protein
MIYYVALPFVRVVGGLLRSECRERIGGETMLEVMKAFAAPTVTALVGAAAIFIQISFNRRQAVIAEDRLKFDLFQRRYAVYKSVKEFLELLAREGESIAFNSEKIKSFYIELDEASFFFGKDIQDFLKEIHDAVEKLVDKLVRRRHASDEERVGFADPLASDQALLRSKHAEVAKRFEEALRFKQLT